MKNSDTRAALLVLPTGTPPSAYAVYMALCLFDFKGTGHVFPSQETIAALTGLTARSVRTAIKLLERVGAIRAAKGTGRGNSRAYTLKKAETISGLGKGKPETIADKPETISQKPETTSADRIIKKNKPGCARPSGGGAPAGLSENQIAAAILGAKQ